MTATKEPSSAIGVEGDPLSQTGKLSEADKIVGEARRKVQEDGVPGIGVSGSNSGKGHDPKMPIESGEDERERKRNMERVVEEEPGLVQTDGSAPEIDMAGAQQAGEETREKLKLPEGAIR